MNICIHATRKHVHRAARKKRCGHSSGLENANCPLQTTAALGSTAVLPRLRRLPSQEALGRVGAASALTIVGGWHAASPASASVA
jgi:hypothetical protein